MPQSDLVHFFEARVGGEDKRRELLPDVGEHVLLLFDEKHPLPVNLVNDVGKILLEHVDVDHPVLPEILEGVDVVFIVQVVIPKLEGYSAHWVVLLQR